jgi:holo-[acyl-carrier protein] synthase
LADAEPELQAPRRAQRAAGERSLSGVAVGLVSVPRFERALARFGERLLARVFTPAERAYAERRRAAGGHSLAARFAAKCAGRRALAALGGRVPRLAELEVVRAPSGEPGLVLATGPLPWSSRLSLTHDAEFALASLVLEQRDAGEGVS